MEEKTKRDKLIGVKCTAEEFEEISKRSLMYGVKNPMYLRNIALNYPLASKVDLHAFLELQKSRGDLGRLGGLLKMWLSDKDRKPGLDQIEVKALLKQIEAKQEEVAEYAKKLVEMGVV